MTEHTTDHILPKAEVPEYIEATALTGQGVSQVQVGQENWYIRPFMDKSERVGRHLQALDELGKFVDVVDVEHWQTSYTIHGKSETYHENWLPSLLATREVPVVAYDVSDPSHQRAAVRLTLQIAEYLGSLPKEMTDHGPEFGPSITDIAHADQYTWLQDIPEGETKPLLIDIGDPAAMISERQRARTLVSVYYYLFGENLERLDKGLLNQVASQIRSRLDTLRPHLSTKEMDQYIKGTIYEQLEGEDEFDEASEEVINAKVDAISQPLIRN